jgi:hypothetical protein
MAAETPAPIEPLAVLPRQASAMIGEGIKHVYDALKAGELDSYEVGNKRLITVESIKAYVARKAEAGRRQGYRRIRSHEPWTARKKLGRPKKER